MVRPNKNLKPRTPRLEAGAAYGEVSDSLEAQAAIPLQEGGGITTPQQANVPAVQAPAQPGPLPLEAAAGYTPQVIPLTAPGRGGLGGIPRALPTPNEEAAETLRNWALAVNEPAFDDAAIQLSQ